MAIIYAIKEGWTIGKIPSHLFGILLLIIPVFLSWLSLALSRFLGAESPVVNCKEFNLADGEFLPIYLGYFFVSVGVSGTFYNGSRVSDSICFYISIADAIL